MVFCERADSLKNLVARVNPEDSAFVRLCSEISELSVLCRNQDDPVYSARRAYMAGLRFKNDINLRMKLMNNLGRQLVLNGRLDSAKLMLDSLKTIAVATGNKAMEGFAYTRLGSYYFRRSRYDSSVRCLHRAIDLLEPLKLYTGLYFAYSSLGLVTGYSGGHANTVLEYHRKSYEYARKAGMIYGMARACSNMSEIYKNLGRYEDALKAVIEAQGYVTKLGIKPPADYSMLDLAMLYSLKKDTRRSLATLEEYRKALDTAYAHGSQFSYLFGENYHIISRVYFQAKDYDRALESGLRALSILGPKNEQTDLIELYFFVSKIYEARHDLRNAMRYRDSSYNMRANIQENDQQRSVQELEARYRNHDEEKKLLMEQRSFELRDAELSITRSRRNLLIVVALLMIVVAILAISAFRRSAAMARRLRYQYRAEAERNEALKELSETKDRLFSLTAHDLRAPVTAFQALPELYERFLRSDDREMMSNLNRMFSNSVSSMLSTIEGLLNRSQLKLPPERPFRPEKLALRPLLQEAAFAYTTAPGKSPPVNPVPDDVFVFADKRSITSAMRQLAARLLRQAEPNEVYVWRFRKEGSFAVIESGPVELFFSGASFEPDPNEPLKHSESAAGLMRGLQSPAALIRQNGGELLLLPDGRLTAFSVRLKLFSETV